MQHRKRSPDALFLDSRVVRAPAGACMNRDWFALPVQLSAVCVRVVHFKIHATLVWLPSFVVVAALASFVVGCACSLGVLVVVALVPLIIGGGCPCSFVVGTAYVRPHRAVEPSTTEIDLDRSDLKSCI